MNPAAGQGPAGPAGPNAPNGSGPPIANGPPMYRPEMMRTLRILTDEERKNYEKGLTTLWTTHDATLPGSPQNEEAKRRIVEFGRMLSNKIHSRRAQFAAQQKQNAQGGQAQQQAQQQQAQHAGQMNQTPQQQLQQGQSGQQPQQQIRPHAPGQPGDTNTGLPPTPTTGSMPMQSQPAAPNAAAMSLNKFPPGIQNHINEMAFIAPPNIPDPERWVNEIKGKYGRALIQMEQSRTNLAKLEAGLKARKEKGPIPPEDEKAINDKKILLQKSHHDAMQFVNSVRSALKNPPNGTAPPGAGPQGGNQARPQGAVRQAPGQQGPGGAPALSTPMQNSSATVNAAIEAAKNQQLAAGIHPQGGGLGGPQGQAPTRGVQAQPLPVAHAPPAQATPVQQPLAHVKVEPGTQPNIPAPLNTALAAGMPTNVSSAGTPTQNSARIQTPQTATAPNIRPLSHSAAINLAGQNIAGQPRPTSGVLLPGSASMQPGHPHAHPPPLQPAGQNNQTINQTQKFTINKVLPEKATQIPTPVPIIGGAGAGRPTLSGGSSIAGGVMNQPAIAKVPAFVLEADSERVLNKKKLDELVRQVCGGTAEGQEGNMLTPEVEESVLSLADNFVDHVLQTACRMAKARGSKVLEIRDLQLVLERQYNIRIPGYSSEELRTVRKAQPNPQWITKMSAVQAAKVMPGKGDL
ncbi:transcription initiation factor TFIID subunit 12 [Podospora conica]|nr:transcription initiation factor TFIID subunit 12 [Schizothecium conicum]